MTPSESEGHTAPQSGSDIARQPAGPRPVPGSGDVTRRAEEPRQVGEGRAAPARPSLHAKASAPVLAKLPPPASVRLAEAGWILSLVAGAIAVVYLFIIRQNLTPDIADVVRAVDDTRVDDTYTSAADIIFWSVFGALVAILLVQLTTLVSFANRRKNTRWWMLGILIFQVIVFLGARQLVALGDRGLALERVLLIQLGLSALGLLFAILPGALKWTARQHDVVRRTAGSAASQEL